MLFIERFLPNPYKQQGLADGTPLGALPRLLAKAEYLRDIEVGIVQEAIGQAFSES